MMEAAIHLAAFCVKIHRTSMHSTSGLNACIYTHIYACDLVGRNIGLGLMSTSLSIFTLNTYPVVKDLHRENQFLEETMSICVWCFKLVKFRSCKRFSSRHFFVDRSDLFLLKFFAQEKIDYTSRSDNFRTEGR